MPSLLGVMIVLLKFGLAREFSPNGRRKSGLRRDWNRSGATRGYRCRCCRLWLRGYWLVGAAADYANPVDPVDRAPDILGVAHRTAARYRWPLALSSTMLRDKGQLRHSRAESKRISSTGPGTVPERGPVPARGSNCDRFQPGVVDIDAEARCIAGHQVAVLDRNGTGQDDGVGQRHAPG